MTAAGGILNEDNGQTHHAIDEHEDVGGGVPNKVIAEQLIVRNNEDPKIGPSQGLRSEAILGPILEPIQEREGSSVNGSMNG